MRASSKFGKALIILRNFGMFLFTFCFVVTCCMLLFLNSFTAAAGVEFKKEYIEFAAKITAVNIVFLSVVCTIFDTVRHYLTETRPIKRIINAAEKVVQGDFSVRIEKTRGVDANDGYNTVIDCFNKMTEELSSVETLRTDFIANVSHELKSPLAVMQSYASLLQKPNLSEEKRMEYAGAISDASRKLADMVTNILKLNKLENQKIYADSRVYDLSEQLCACFLSFENLWEKKGLEIETDIEENISVEADPELLSIVWNNLISNAIKFTEPGGKISLSAKRDGELAAVEIADAGCGISPETGKHIFEKFYQGDSSHAAKGNGLGLALVKRVIDIIGGDIAVKSEVGKGSVFTVRLRRVNDEA